MTQAIRDARTQRAALLNSNPRLTLNTFEQLKREQGRTPHVEDLVLRVSSIKSGRMLPPRSTHTSHTSHTSLSENWGVFCTN